MAVPCLNTSRVAGAVRGHAEWRRPRVSTARIADGHGRKEPHAMTMEKRRGKGRGRTGALPEECIAFAESDPGIDVNEHVKRRDTGTGHGMVGDFRIKTSSRSEAVRTLCLVLSLAVRNS